MQMTSEVKIFDADTLDYAGSILVYGREWKYSEVNDSYMIQVTSGMPLKAVLGSLINFNKVYDIIPVNDGELNG
jgi:hypothetical protein